MEVAVIDDHTQCKEDRRPTKQDARTVAPIRPFRTAQV